MGILTNDDGLVDAALSEMLSLPLDQRVALDPHHDVESLLVKHYLSQVSDVHSGFHFGSVTNFFLTRRAMFLEHYWRPRRVSLLTPHQRN